MNLAWIDLETTGHDTPDEGSVLEVGLVVTDLDLNELWQADWRVEPDLWHVATMPKVVRQMHLDNGLLAAIDHERALRTPEPLVEPAPQVDLALSHVLEQYETDGKLALAGSGVGHYDRTWMAHHLPRSLSRLRYWNLDIGVVRRFMGLVVGRAEMTEHRPGRPDSKAHRALDDALDHVAEARWYRDQLATNLRIGDRTVDGGIMGTIVRCGHCGGSGQLHDPDELPPRQTPQCGHVLDDYDPPRLCLRDGNHTGEHRPTPDIAF